MKTKVLMLFSALFLLTFSVNLMAQGKGKKEAKKNKGEVEFAVDMHCDKCKKKIEKSIPFEKGVTDLKVNLSAKTVKIQYKSDKTDEAKLKAAIEKLGYNVSVIKGITGDKRQEEVSSGNDHDDKQHDERQEVESSGDYN